MQLTIGSTTIDVSFKASGIVLMHIAISISMIWPTWSVLNVDFTVLRSGAKIAPPLTAQDFQCGI